MTRSLVSLLDVEGDDVRKIAAATLAPRDAARPLAGQIVAVLAFGGGGEAAAPWIAAAQRLGAGVLRREDLGEPAADAFAVSAEAARWADLLVLSHPHTGFARAIASSTGRSVVNAGEGGGEDPAGGISLLAASLADAFPAGSAAARPLRAAVCGDLWESRGARGFLAALAAVGATVLLVPARGRDLPDAEVRRLARKMGRNPLRFEAHAMSSLLDMVDTVLLAPEETPQLPLFREVGVPPDEAARRARREVEDLDVLFVAAGAGARDRIVREPFRGRATRTAAHASAHGSEHQTPARAFEAVLAWAAGDGTRAPAGSEPSAGRYRSAVGMTCRGDRCVAARHADHVTPDFLVLTADPPRLECAYCGEGAEASFAASKIERRFHAAGSSDALKILPANLVLFRDRAEALAAGFEPPRRRARPALAGGETAHGPNEEPPA